jgi:hypothetical protein
MEALVGIALLGVVYTVIFSLMSTSLRNISRMEEREKIVRLGQMKLNELVLNIGRGPQDTPTPAGRFDEKYSWRATIQEFDRIDSTDLPVYIVNRVRLSVEWAGSMGPRRYDLETLVWSPERRQP